MARSISTRLALLFAFIMVSTLLLGAIALWQEMQGTRLADENARNLREVAAIERINGCIELRELQEPNLQRWLGGQTKLAAR